MNSSKIVFIALLLGVFNVFSIQEMLAQPQSANPLETPINQNDPLIPADYGQRKLTYFEKYRIKKAIAKLDQRAKAELAQGNGNKAFKLWYRQLKLARTVDLKTEIKALGDVGATAWQQTRGTDVRNIAERLIAIQEKLTTEKLLSPSLLNNFATAYQQVRYIDKEIVIYQKILTNSRKANNLVAEQNNLKTLGKLYLARFDYFHAADVYQELLILADRGSKSTQEVDFYLNTLMYIYDRTEQANKAIAIKKRLIKQYTAAQKLDRIPALTMAIADDYKTSKKPDKAINAYNQAFETASKLQQFALASDALTKLGKTYQQSKNTDKAIATYTKLLKVQQQTYNYYGLINTYDNLGQIYLQLNQKSQAKQYFQQALELAKSLNYKIKYFDNRVKIL